MLVVYGISNCDTVKKARSFLENSNVDYSFVDFKKTKPTKDNIVMWKKFLGDFPVNKKGTTYKKFKEEYELLDEAKKVDFIIENSSMIKRPIFEKKSKVLAIGYSPDDLKGLIFG